MRRREFVGLLGGAAVGWAIPARAQPQVTKRMGFLTLGAEDNPAIQGLLRVLRDGLNRFGWIESGCARLRRTRRRHRDREGRRQRTRYGEPLIFLWFWGWIRWR